jgi:GAF domain-containing protein/anti-sigma regulatory factor (Ser/Thr protein kinase)
MNSLFHLAAPEWTLLKDPVRLRALAACGVFATSPETQFDDLVSLASLTCQCTSAMICFADAESLHFKGRVGANKNLLQKVADSFFLTTIQHDVYVWNQIPPLNQRGLNQSPENIAFYAGVPLRAENQQIIGVLCVTDTSSRDFPEFQREALIALGRQTEHQLTLRRLIAEQTELLHEREKDLDNRRQSEARLASALSRVSLVHEISKAARSREDPTSILKTALTKLGYALSADRCYFVTYDPAANIGVIGPDWFVEGLTSISTQYKMFDFSYNRDPQYLSGATSVIEDVLIPPLTPGAVQSVKLGLRSLLRAPIIQGEQVTALCVAMTTPRRWSEDEVALVETVAAQTRAAVETSRHALRERALLRDVLASVTEGKLILAESPENLPASVPAFDEPILLDKAGGLAELRELIRVAGKTANHSEVRTFDTVTAASEAGMNAIVHAESGYATVGISENGIVQIRIEDRGAGIAFEELPKATLVRGYSTKSTLGHGLKMMLETIDRLFLLTGPTGTTVILEQEPCEQTPLWLTRHHEKK